jgi:hypothetical protein
VSELSSEGTDATKHPVHHNRQSGHWSIGKDSPVRSDPWDAEASTNLVADIVWRIDGLMLGDTRRLRRRAKRAIGLGAVHPHATADPTRIYPCGNRLDDSSTVTVRDHPRERHRRTKPSTSLLGVAWVHTREPEPDLNLTRSRFTA